MVISIYNYVYNGFINNYKNLFYLKILFLLNDIVHYYFVLSEMKDFVYCYYSYDFVFLNVLYYRRNKDENFGFILSLDFWFLVVYMLNFIIINVMEGEL